MPRSQYAGLELNSKLTLSKQWGPSPTEGFLIRCPPQQRRTIQHDV